MDIARVAESSASSPIPLELHISIYVTCLCNPEAIPPIPNCSVTIIRPSVYRVLRDLTGAAPAPVADRKSRASSASEDSAPGPRRAYADREKEASREAIEVVDAEEDATPRMPFVAQAGGGLAVCASGPEGLIREAANAVARLQMSGRGVALGGIALHTEIFSL